MIHGIINLWKPEGPTSHDMVAKLRKIVGQKRIGHTGTLDPMASGILPLCFGDATRLAEYFTNQIKEYRLTLKFGYESDTYDRTGILQPGPKASIDKYSFKRMLHSMEGESEQIPPMHSAISINGTRLYELARKGIEVERNPRKIQIFEIEILNDLPEVIQTETLLELRVQCSKGTYIRSFCHDLGNRVGCGAVLMELERTSNGFFKKENSVTLEEIEQSMHKNTEDKILFSLKPDHLELPAIDIDEQQYQELNHGRIIFLPNTKLGSEVVLFHGSRLLGIGNAELFEQGSLIKPKKMLANPLQLEVE